MVICQASMGPQLYSCGNYSVIPVHVWHWVSFNGATTLQLRKFADAGLLSCPTQLLQWGHNFTVAEMPPLGKKITIHDAASMGPQLYSCGNAQAATKVNINPDASMGPQLYSCGNYGVSDTDHAIDLLLQWGHNFTVAEIVK